MHRSPIAMMVELADDIAYACHDFEDAMRAGFIGINQLDQMQKDQKKHSIEHKFLNRIEDKLDKGSNGKLNHSEHFRSAQKRVKSFLVNRFVLEAIKLKGKINPKFRTCDYSKDIKTNLFFDGSQKLKKEIALLKSLTRKFVIYDPSVQFARFASVNLLNEFMNRHKDIFTWELNQECHAFRALPKSTQEKLEAAPNVNARLQVFLDYVSGMTDTYLLRRASFFSNPSKIHSIILPP